MYIGGTLPVGCLRGTPRTHLSYIVIYLTYLLMLSKQQLIAAAAGSILTLGLGAGSLTFAQTATTTPATGASTTAPAATPGDCHGMMGHGHGIHGTVSSISGNTLTVTATNPKDSTTTVYTVDASSATVLKGDGTAKPASSTLSSVAVGDTVLIDGQLSGTSVTAKMIIDGPLPQKGMFNSHRPLKVQGSGSTTTQ
jgi:hypothetical protein